ncbi:M61 family metallopeptidase [Brumimicrobium aurantiacum]|uniref:M61 family peptidase n=1 Tax=Brumimicrobium aurantiacum TaxID=1737063 RepID=A0A3E1EZJ7_9FLAO|nr:M61 family metallopeptidase [Brumimicrobium aurantiacum]RFC54978.1 M61 family peptidase [Brumimicrobium aurantiacum]
MKFTFDIESPHKQYIQITAEIEVSKAETELFFPAWRPGRYELGDFAKNVNHFQILDEKGEKVEYQKSNKNTWIVQTSNVQTITVKYSYYAKDLNAGSTFLDASQLYVNPVNCCVFTDEIYNDPIQVELNIPDAWDVAHSLKVDNNSFTAANYDELVDSPFICSGNLQKTSYTVEGTTFYIWFNGIVKPDWKRLENDFKAFTISQIKAFSKFPTDEYHYLIQVLPYATYHGVEHSKSTVITLGPSYAVFEEFYKELLGVSSHELYHTWNVKSIRPVEMMPYNFKEENYTELGYIAEGVTTYMGDLMLYKSGVFNLKQYLQEMDKQIQKHMDNFGRLNYSVADSSFDTWLDGYVPGAPERKVSIYTEGCLLAFILDVHILKHTNNEKCLDDLMRELYLNYGDKGIGVSKADYLKEVERITNQTMQWFFDDYLHGTKAYTPLLIECLNEIGIKYNSTPVKSEFAAYLGAKIVEVNEATKIAALFPNSILDQAGAMVGDELLAMNGVSIQKNADRWARYFKNEEKVLIVNRGGKLIQLELPKSDEVYYQRYYLSQMKELSQAQKATFEAWKTV